MPSPPVQCVTHSLDEGKQPKEMRNQHGKLVRGGQVASIHSTPEEMGSKVENMGAATALRNQQGLPVTVV